MARALNDGCEYVVSTTMQHADWGDTTILRSLDEVRALRSGDGQGGGGFMVEAGKEAVST